MRLVKKIARYIRKKKKEKEVNENWHMISEALAKECDRLIEECKRKDQIINTIVGNLHDAQG